jgi:hypothetical protein
LIYTFGDLCEVWQWGVWDEGTGEGSEREDEDFWGEEEKGGEGSRTMFWEGVVEGREWKEDWSDSEIEDVKEGIFSKRAGCLWIMAHVAVVGEDREAEEQGDAVSEEDMMRVWNKEWDSVDDALYMFPNEKKRDSSKPSFVI